MSGEEQQAADPADEVESEVWPRVVRLRYPIEWGSESITQLTFRRGRLGDIKAMRLSKEVPTDQLVTIASRLSGQPTQVIEKLDVDDAGEVLAIALDFYGRCLGAGKTLSG